MPNSVYTELHLIHITLIHFVQKSDGFEHFFSICVPQVKLKLEIGEHTRCTVENLHHKSAVILLPKVPLNQSPFHFNRKTV